MFEIQTIKMQKSSVKNDTLLNDLVVKALDSQSRGVIFKTTG